MLSRARLDMGQKRTGRETERQEKRLKSSGCVCVGATDSESEDTNHIRAVNLTTYTHTEPSWCSRALMRLNRRSGLEVKSMMCVSEPPTH